MRQEMHNELPQDTTITAHRKAHIVELKAPFLAAEKDGAFPYKHAVPAAHQHEACLTTGWPHSRLSHPFHAFPQARPLAVRASFFPPGQKVLRTVFMCSKHCSGVASAGHQLFRWFVRVGFRPLLLFCFSLEGLLLKCVEDLLKTSRVLKQCGTAL